jgi:hypothetical protein
MMVEIVTAPTPSDALPAPSDALPAPSEALSLGPVPVREPDNTQVRTQKVENEKLRTLVSLTV